MQRFAADAAIGRKQHREQAVRKVKRNSSCPRPFARQSNRRPCNCGSGLDSPNSVSTTAEDGLRDPGENRNVYSLASITAFHCPRQRCVWFGLK
jgi:hypothetical protein